MTDYDAGTARAVYDLDLTRLRAAVAEAKRLYADMAQAATHAAAGGQGAGGSAAQTAATQAATRATQTQAQAMAAAQREALALAQAEARLLQAKGQIPDAIATINSALAQQTERTRQVIAAETQMQRLQNSQGGAGGPAVLPRTFAGFTRQGFAEAAATFGLFNFGPQIVGSAIQGGMDAGRSALDLERTKRLTLELAGSQTIYNQVLASAREQQALYGGTLKDNIEGLSGLVVTSHQSGASLGTLIDLSQRLSVLDPAQGLQGARIALSEALSGDPTSLARRFEIPRSELAKLRDETIPVEDRLRVVGAYLDKVGVSSGAAAASISADARAYNALGAAVEDVKIKIGGYLAASFAPAALGGARLLTGDTAAMGASLRQSALDANLWKSAIAQTNPVLGQLAGWMGLDKVAAEQAAAAQRQQADAAQAQASAAQGAGQASADMAKHLDTGALSAKAEEDALASASKAAYESQNNHGSLSDQARAAAQALFDSGAAGASAAAQLAASSDQVDQMTAAQYRLMVAAQSSRAAMTRGQEGGLEEQRNARALQEQAATRQRAQYEKDVSNAIIQSTGSTQQQLDLVREQIKTAPALSDQRKKLLVEQAQLEQKLSNEAGKGARSATKDAATVAKAYETEYQAARDAAQKIEDIQRNHYDKLRQMTEDYQLSQSRKEEDFQQKYRRLLAEGKRAEAEQAKADFDKEKRRAAEDQAIAVRRDAEKAAKDIADAQRKAATDARDRAAGRQIGGDALPGDAAALAGQAVTGRTVLPAIPAGAAQTAQARAALASTAGMQPAAGAGPTVRIEFAPIALQVDGQTVASVTYPYIERRLVEDLTTISASAPITTSIAGGARP